MSKMTLVGIRENRYIYEDAGLPLVFDTPIGKREIGAVQLEDCIIASPKWVEEYKQNERSQYAPDIPKDIFGD